MATSLLDEIKASALEVASTAVLVIDRQRKVLWANRAFEQLTGYRLAELTRLPTSEALSPETTHAEREAAWVRVLDGGVARREGASLLTRNGEELRVSGSWTPVVEQGHFFMLVELVPQAGRVQRGDLTSAVGA